MALKDFLKKKADIERQAQKQVQDGKSAPYQPEFTFLRTTTSSQEVIHPPIFPGDQEKNLYKVSKPKDVDGTKKRRSIFHSHSHKDEATPAAPSSNEHNSESTLSSRPKADRKISERFSQLRIRSSSAASTSSVLPDTLDPAPAPLPAPLSPDINGKFNHATPTATTTTAAADSPTTTARQQAAWEARAKQLALSQPVLDRARSPSPTPPASQPSTAATSSAKPDDDDDDDDDDEDDEATLHRAITLHETGDLTASTALFGRLASPAGANSALAQVLYGLALRHGWGCPVDAPAAVHYLSLAAANAAASSTTTTTSASASGGGGGTNSRNPAANKGELVLAIYELANCYRYAWGTARDPRAAREYYAAAANLGDLDAMEEVAWCHLEGFGGPKDRALAAAYLRRAELGGRKRVGESWIWKEKYNPK